MKDNRSSEVVRRIKEIVERYTHGVLPRAAEEEIYSTMRDTLGSHSGFGASVPVEQRVTILLADLRGFTALAATQPARTLTELLNLCLSRLSDVIYRYSGTIDKFMGDALMVLFGAPVQRDDDVVRALACAIEMQLAMRDLNAEHERAGLPQLHLGIGINTGVVMAGRFGGDAYSQYTVIGAQVNLASRIEAFSLRGQVLISESTYQQCASDVIVTKAMEVYVKGRPEPVCLRELVAFPALNLKVPRQEFRRSHRVEAKMPGTLWIMRGKIVLPQPIKASIRDIGYHGLLLSLDRQLAIHTEVKLEFDLMLVDYRAADLYAKVVNTTRSAGRWLTGLEFTSMSAEADTKIQVFVQLLVGGQ